MQNQKTIAKWLAIILLLTVIVACYFILSAVIDRGGNQKIDIAGADTRGDGNTTAPPDEITVPPVYSEFPRAAETVNNVAVRHIGGDNTERALDSIYYSGKRLVLFFSASSQYDVRESGIHIASFVGDSLISVTKIADISEEFVKLSLVQNGLLVITKTAAQTILRLFDGNCTLLAQNTCSAYSSYSLHLSGAAATLFAADASYIYVMTITKSLDVVRSNFVYPLGGATFLYTFRFGTTDTLIVQTKTDIGILTFSATNGFIFKNELINCRFMQLLPIISSGKQALIIASETDRGVLLSNIGSDCALTDSYLLEEEKTAVCLPQENGNIAVLTKRTHYVFCSHLELQSSSALNIDESVFQAFGAVRDGDLKYMSVDGESKKFIIENDSAFAVVSFDGAKVTPLFFAAGTSPQLVCESVTLGSAISVLFNADSTNSFSYMCFGDTDVFYVTLPAVL